MTKNKEIFRNRTFQASFIDDEEIRDTPEQIQEKIEQQRSVFENQIPELLKKEPAHIESLASKLRTSNMPVFDPGELPSPPKRRRRH